MTPRFNPPPLASRLCFIGAIALLLAACSADAAPPEAIRPEVAPVVAEVQPRTVADERRVAGTPTTIEGRVLRLAVRDGVVTALPTGPGASLVAGSPVVAVDGVTRVAVRTEAPFYRTLEAGDTGPDVAALNEVLVRLGYLAAIPSPATNYTFGTSQAVRALEKAAGLAITTGVFDPALVVWLPAEPFVVGEVELVIGAPAPAPGAAALKEAPRLAKVTLTAANPGEALTLDPAVQWVLVIGKERFAIDVAKLEVAEADLARLQTLLKPKQERIDGVVQRSVPLEALAVPSTAVQVGRDGGLCAWLPEGESYRAVALKVAGARAGVTNVVGGLEPGARVLANPVDVLEAPQCPSP